MLNLKASVTEAANRVSERLTQVASEAAHALTGSLSRAGNRVVDGVLDQAEKWVGPVAPASAPRPAAPEHLVAAHGKAAAKKRKQARLAMQRLVKAAKRTASSARR